MKRRLQAFVLIALGTALAAAACSNNNQQTTTPTPTPAAPTVTESFSGTLPVGGTKFFSFKVSQYGTVQVSLLDVSGTDVPSTVTLTLGLGTPSGTTCSAGTSVAATTADMMPQLSTTLDVGVYCASIADPGNLSAPANFSITIAHP
jgi:hypothetical protein